MTKTKYSTAGPVNMTGTKRCTSCNTTKPLTQFQWRTEKKRNNGYFNSRCRACDTEYKRTLEQKKREAREFLKLIESVGVPPCESCPEKIGCKVECERFEAYAEGLTG